MTPRMTTTLAICIGGGLAAGIALARPGHPAPPAAAPAPAATAAPAPAEPAPAADPAAPAEPAATAAPAPAEMTIADFTFSSLSVAASATVNVTNTDSAPHTATATDGAFDTGNIDGGGTGSFIAPSTPGTYAFFCAIHPSMTANLVVI